MDPDRHRGYAFGDFVLDLDRCALLRSGRDTGLEPREIHVLAILVEHQGVPVTRDQLTSVVWRDQRPADDALDRCVEAIRRAVDDGQADSALAAVDDAYRFDREVEPLEELAIPPTLGKRHHREPFALALIALIVLLFIVLWLTDSPEETNAPGEAPHMSEPG